MRAKLKLIMIGFGVIICSCNTSKFDPEEESSKYAPYIGRYALKSDLILDVKDHGGLLTLLPSFWGSAQILDSVGPDKFVSLLHPRMQFEFSRDSLGQVIALTSNGNRELNGTATKLSAEETRAVELLLSDRIQAAIQKIKSDTAAFDEGRITNLGFKLISNYPSRAGSAVSFVSAFEQDFLNSLDLQQLMGLGNLMAGDREEARKSFRKAFALDSSNGLNNAALWFLDPENAPAKPKDTWKLQFGMDELFAPVSKEEVAAVKKMWAGRDLRPRNVQQVYKRSVELDGCTYSLRILQHEIEGSKHYGALFIPEGAQPGNSPIVLDLHGVDPSYSPFNVLKVKTSKILTENRQKVIIAVPSFRGNTLNLDDEQFISEGDPTNAWDGATDDALAFLNVALDHVPEVDPNKIAAFGKSRGGTVAMLAGVRDKRIKCVINWAGPAGWFDEMGTFGFKFKEQVQWGLWTKGKGWGSSSQFIEWFLETHIQTGTPDLKTIRRNILASSPVYFLDDLPAAQLHYGIEDRSVPYANAIAIKEALNLRDSPNAKFELYGHQNTGHDQPYPKAFMLSRQFLLEQFEYLRLVQEEESKNGRDY